MKEQRVSFMEVLSYIMVGESKRCASYRRRVFDKLESTLEKIDKHKRGREIINRWATDRVCTIVD